MTVMRIHRAHSSVIGICLVGLVFQASATQASTTRLLDGFEDLGAWKALASDGVTASARPVQGREGGALRLDFDFGAVAGYAFARRKLPLDLPENYEISFHMRAEAPVNTFEVKLADGSGDNVWWSQRRDFTFPSEWKEIRIKKRQIGFAWGPTQDRTLRRADSLEFVVTAGRDGGRGSIEIDQLSIRELPPEPAAYPVPKASASATLASSAPGHAVDGDRATVWRSGPDGPRSLTFDLGLAREFGGLGLEWADDAFASRYDVLASDDGVAWRTVRSVRDGDGGRDALLLPDEEARFLRIDMQDGPQEGFALSEIKVEDLAFGASPNAFIERIAKDAPRGDYPRGFSGEQSYWTVVGVDGGRESGLMSEDGALEVARGGFSIEPFIMTESGLVSWAGVEISQSLADGYLPIPSVAWRHEEWEMRATTFAIGTRDNGQLVARYTVTNRTDKQQSIKLALAARPFQVNPPTQSLNIAGGVSAITSLKWDDGKLWVNGQARVMPLERPSLVTARTFDSGATPDRLLETPVGISPPLLASPASGEGPRRASGAAPISSPWGEGLGGGESQPMEVTDETGFAAGALVYDLDLAPGATATVGIVAPLAGDPAVPDLAGQLPEAWLDAREQEVAEAWRGKLNRVTFDVPEEGRQVVDTLRSSLAHILMSRDGPILRPGTRSYGRSWIRDGAMISESLVRLGHADIAADYLRWFAPHQFANGKVPCCVDSRGADPVPENDSHGQLIFLAAEVYRYTGDKGALEAVWPQVNAAALYMDGLRASERTPANQTPERRMLWGLLPPSISHEGYAAKPAYSYWDGYWGLLGYKDATAIATALGKTEAAGHFARQRDEFRLDLTASLRATAEVHGIPYLAGAADLGDFDATSTTIALAPGGERAHLPDDLLLGTFERYWRNFADRRDGRKDWNDYTPYELRSVGTFIQLGQRERAHEALDFFFKDQRPKGWNQWAEVVGRDARQPRFIGDMPHAWVSSDYIRSALAMFAYDRESDGALVLGAGLPKAWLEREEIAVNGLRTPHGTLNYSLRREGKVMVLAISGDAKPPGGFVFEPPWPGVTPRVACRKGQDVAWRGGALHVANLPAEVVIDGESLSPMP